MECAIARVKPKVNHELQMIMMGQCRFINCNTCTTLQNTKIF